MRRVRHSLLQALALIAVAALGAAFSPLAAESYREPFRPRFHFTPATNWMNDPNGLVFHEGEYHLFYQFNPFGNKWGHMSWGHAVSKDLVVWEHLPIALLEENDVMIFSGSAVVDRQNTSGFGRDSRPPLVAIFTGHYTKKPLQNQHLAYSNDRGRTWTKYAGNPVLDIGAKDFRDPKVFWHEPTKRWVMVIAWPVERKVRFYASPNLKDWTHLSDFGPAGSTVGIWECPDLFPLAVEGGRGRKKWTLIVNVGSGAPAGGSGCQYFVGEFDGERFSFSAPSAPPTTAGSPTPADKTPAFWADFGPDFYAAVSWSDVPKRDGRRLWLGWMSNWQYANDVPTSPWRSTMSLPRTLTLRETGQDFRLIQQPVRELRRLRGKAYRLGRATLREANDWLARKGIRGEQWEFEIEFQVATGDRAKFGLNLLGGTNQSTVIGCDTQAGRLTLDRRFSGQVGFHSQFPGVYSAPLPKGKASVRLHVYLDRSSVEVFAGDGEVSLSALVLPGPSHLPAELWAADNSAVTLRRMNVWRLKSAWP